MHESGLQLDRDARDKANGAKRAISALAQKKRDERLKREAAARAKKR